MGEDESEPAEPSEPARVDSTEDFTGAERQVAQVVEDFEAAVLADDVETICRDLLAVKQNRGYDDDNGGHEFCVTDEANQPDEILAAAGERAAYDLVVESIERDGNKAALKRFKALVDANGGTQEFVVERYDGSWAITVRDLSPDDELTAERKDRPCERATISVRTSLVPHTNDPQKAVLQGPFGTRIERELDKGGSFELDHVAYRPDYVLSYTLRDRKGDFIGAFPVRVWGPRSFDVYSYTFCRDGQMGMIII